MWVCRKKNSVPLHDGGVLLGRRGLMKAGIGRDANGGWRIAWGVPGFLIIIPLAREKGFGHKPLPFTPSFLPAATPPPHLRTHAQQSTMFQEKVPLTNAPVRQEV